MVVLEGGGMLSSSSNQYLQPDYLSPLPTTLDAKKSPLALLAQTCSQIGADTPSSKPLISPLEKTKKSSSSSDNRTSPASAREKTEKSAPRNSPSETKLAFKPYENITTSKKTEDSRPTSKSSVHNSDAGDSKSDRKSASPANSNTTTPAPENGKTTPSSDRKSTTPSARGASPIIRSGLEILQGHKESPLGSYKPGLPGLTALPGPLGSLCCPPGLEHTNPAFRPPFPGGPFSHHHAMLGYPGTTPGPYLSYARVKTPSGGEALVPVCKDPYCGGCQFSLHNQLMASGQCPSGCSQCDHQKYNLAMAMSLVPPGPVPPSSLSYPQLGRPYVCNWIVGDTYCGKRFVSSDELLQHLRTHTSASDAASVVATSTASSLLNPHSLFSSSALHRYPNPPLSPLSAARYHPYGKPTLPSTLGASPYSAFNPTALGPYYSPYSVYGQRLGSAAVHP
ncbi:zinc finger protein Noc [Onthophagus taurus]|uniref:zinc finger protein Noc n=1 Tax=Onthophagus taurus TaxID=166361 RepID=UPI000C204CDC|nr:zinc finger protein Noc [Onthophagus taurus]